MRHGLLSRLLEGDLSCFGAPPLSEAVAGRVRAEQMASVVRYTPALMLANVCAVPILAAALWSTADHVLLCGWAAVMVGLASHLFVARLRRAGRRPPEAVSTRAIRVTIRNALVLGALWSAIPLVFFGDATSGGQMIIVSLIAGVLCSAAFGLATIPVAATAFTTPLFLSIGAAFLTRSDPVYALAAMLLFVYGGVILRVVYSHGIQFASRFAQHVAAEQRASTDPLTQLPNRVAFQGRFDAAFQAPAHQASGFAVLCLDFDGFKAVNDTYGHQTGDELLVQAAERLRACTSGRGTCARLGGDEFAVIAPGLDRAGATALAADLVQAFEEPFTIDHVEVCCSVSIGIALAPADGENPRSLLKSADIALYQAKQSRGGSFRFFEARQSDRERQRRLLAQELRQALQKGEFRLHYQPILDLRSGRVAGCEALLRWQHPTRGIVLPKDFLPTAEVTGLIGRIGEWVIREACRTASEWPSPMRVAVNLSTVQLRHPAILVVVTRALAEHGLAPQRLEIEVAEGGLTAEDGMPLEVLRRLARLGVGIALDDFGMGYSCLNYLRTLPLQRVKIDRIFGRDLLADPDCAAIVKAVIGLASDLAIATTAEGVETEAQRAWLQSHGCSEVQGDLVGRPCAPEVLVLPPQDQGGRARVA